MAQAGKTRIYDLAKELKLDNKKVIEDARREGIDVSVPSNTVPTEVAERIRTKYFPKKATPKVAPRLVKHPTQPLVAPEVEVDAPVDEAPAVEAPRLASGPKPVVEKAEPHRPQVRI